MPNPFDVMREALAELQRVAPPVGGGVYEVENLGAGLYRLAVRRGVELEALPVVARPARMARTLRTLAATA